MRALLSWRGALVLIAVVALGFLPLIVSAYILGIFTAAYYFGVFSMSWDLLFGFAGEVNFGPTFLIGIGAYAAGLLDGHGVPLWLCIPLAGVCSVIAGLLLAIPALRLRGPYFGLVTLVAVLLLQNIIVIFAGFTGGEIGLSLPDVLSIDAGTNYYYAFVFMLVSGILLTIYARSPVGLILQATGQDPIQAQALGFNVTKHKLAAFCVSALFSGLAGAMLVFYLGTASVGTVVDIAVAVQVIIAAVLGGRRTIFGAALGALFLLLAAELLRPLGQLSNFVVAAVALAVILVFPDGFVGLATRERRRA